MYVGAGGTHVRCIYDGGISLERNAEWKCMFKYWDPRKYKSKELWSRYYKVQYCEKYIFTLGCTSLQLLTVIEKFKLSSKRPSSPWKRQRFCGCSKKHYATSWVMNPVNLSAQMNPRWCYQVKAYLCIDYIMMCSNEQIHYKPHLKLFFLIFERIEESDKVVILVF